MQQLTLLLANSNPIPSMHTWSRPPCPDFMSWTGNSPPSSGPRIYNIYKTHYMFYLVSKNWSHFYILKEKLACIFKGSNYIIPQLKQKTYCTCWCMYMNRAWSQLFLNTKMMVWCKETSIPGNFPLFLAAVFSIDSLTQK